MEYGGVHKPAWDNSGVWTYNLHLQEVWLSPPLQQLLETSGKQPVESFIAIAHPDDRPALRKLIADLWDGKPVQTVFRAITKSGINRHILLSGELVPITNEDVLLAAGLASDLQSQLSYTTRQEAKKGQDFQALHHASIETLIINHQTVEVFWSDNLFSLLGFGQQDFTPTPEHLFSLLHPQDVELLREEQDTPREIRLKTRADGFKWFLVISKKIMEVESLVSRMIYEFTDIDYLKRSEHELNRKNQDLAGIMQSSSTYMVLIDEKLDVIFYNDKANEAFLPVRKKVPLSQWSKYFINTNDASLARRLHIAFHKNVIHNKYLESEISMADNSQKTIAWYLSLVNYHGQKMILCTGVDVTANRQTTSKLIEQNKQLKEFAYMASHNLRGPVVNCLSLLQLYKQSENTDEKDLFIEKVGLVTNKLLSTIDDFSGILKNNDKNLQAEEIAFDTVLNDTVHLFSETIAQTQACIYSDFTKCAVVNYRKMIIESIFQNLISNSIKYRNILSTPRIRIESKLVDGRCVLTFEDNGIGFDMQKYGDKIFGLYNTFHQNEDARGVGLYLIKSQVEELGGQVLLDSQPEQGSLFTIVL